MGSLCLSGVHPLTSGPGFIQLTPQTCSARFSGSRDTLHLNWNPLTATPRASEDLQVMHPTLSYTFLCSPYQALFLMSRTTSKHGTNAWPCIYSLSPGLEYKQTLFCSLLYPQCLPRTMSRTQSLFKRFLKNKSMDPFENLKKFNRSMNLPFPMYIHTMQHKYLRSTS